MNIELYEEQVATVCITLEGEADVYKVYGGTSKGQFHTEVGDDDMHWEIYVPAESTAGCSVPRYDIFAKRVSTGQEWRILSGKIATKKRQSQVEGECVSPVEYHVTLPLVEDMVIVDGGQVLIGIKGDKGESAYELVKQHGYSGTEIDFTNMLTDFEAAAERAVDAQILAEIEAINAVKASEEAKVILKQIKSEV